MKVIHVVCNPSTGVLSLITSLVAEQSKNKDVNFSLIVVYDKTINIKEVDSSFVNFDVEKIYSPIKINTIFYFLFFILSKFFTFFNQKDTFYHFHNAQMSAAFLNKKNKNNSLITIHGFPAYDSFMANKKSIVRRLHFLFFKRIVLKKLIVSSVDYVSLEKIKKCFGTDLTNSFVIPNCCNLNLPTVSSEEKRNTIKFVFIGAIDENKGISKIVDVFNKLIENYELHVFGSGEQLYSLIDNNVNNKKIFFYGNVQRSEVLKLLPLFDVYISFSHTEGFSMSFIEALASGLSVITTNWGDVRRYINNNGYVINRNEEDLEQHILRFFENDRTILNEMKDESIKIFQQNLSPLIVSDRYQIIYEKSK
ncbi:glycosyltransferase family 4 protein [Elizabethkingia anophelis]|uniref:Glycosyl transferase family 1 domain-containing protein n=1 Tax=Elizabethkingia anophelis TaxID=1117645 RepID=X5K637_9FLAO|nr:glycosyltransferase [Elizabethkingia anophelis]AQW97068.1 hypothetical protein BBD31_03780 [Elizabethkingia anophelis]AQX49317.1 hypothetical protein AYC66_00850 [Elizabethkingia anophelis]AQX87662.1 hypothetical protein AYC67_00850 [Elizabethkingia anophelis]ASV80212.1 glycosyltransferase family 1 protein [Elizabethkingia anophelis]AVF48052.1 glycosyltransferase family 1 protein [Elizabethkingia anophelis]